ncbi:MAG: transposase [Deltaproteobacteria bacterium]|nr:transposase [Deltaproteobacteria bacterium]
MELSSIINQYQNSYINKYGNTALPGHLKAIKAICRCRTPDSGELYLRCNKCNHTEWRPLSCGHRSCPKCQNYEASKWIDRQLGKLLPVQYFMTTFTLPYELRSLTCNHQKTVYSILFICASSTLKDFGLNLKNLGAEMGMTMVLHTHSRKLDFHPHIHAVTPGGGVDKQRRQWKKKKGKYLFNEYSMAKVFRARFIDALNNAGLSIPRGVPSKWVVDCKKVGKGITALKYLSRYLYRGVISEKNIVSNKNGKVAFKYIESETGYLKFRTLKGEDFLHLILQHVLPKGFRRVRDYGFLHSNAKRMLFLIQLILHVKIKEIKQRTRPEFKCPHCKSSMVILGFQRCGLKPG